MKIYVRTNGLEKLIHLTIPNNIIFNQMTSRIISKTIHITTPELNQLISDLQQSIKEFGHFNLVHVESSERDIVDIVL